MAPHHAERLLPGAIAVPPESEHETPGGYGLWAAMLVLTMLTVNVSLFAFGAVAPQVRIEFGVRAGEIGLLIGLYFSVGILGSFITGPLVARFGAPRMLVITLSTSLFGLLLASRAPSFGALFVSAVPLGLAMSGATPSVNVWASMVDGRLRTQVIGWSQAGVPSAALLAGLIAGGTGLGLDWRDVFGWGAIGVATTLVIALRVLRDPFWRTGPARIGRDRPQPLMREEIRGTTPVLLAFAGLVAIGVTLFSAVLPLYAVDAVGLAPGVASLTTGVWGLMALTVRLLLGRYLPQHVRLTVFLTTCGALSVVSVLLVAGAAQFTWLLWVGVALSGMVGPAWSVPVMLHLMVRSLSPARVTGWLLGIYYAGLWFGSFATGQAIDRVGYGAALALSTTAFVASLLVVVTGRLDRPPAHRTIA